MAIARALLPASMRSFPIAVVLLAAAAFGVPPAAAEAPPERPDGVVDRACVPAKKGERFLVDFEDLPLSQLARLVSCAAERNIMFEPAGLGQKTVTVISARPVSLRDLIGLWHTVLHEQGLTAERRGAFELVRPLQGATPPAP